MQAALIERPLVWMTFGAGDVSPLVIPRAAESERFLSGAASAP